MAKQTDNFMDLFLAAGPDDLAKLQAVIAEKRTALADYVSKAESEIKAIETIAKALDIKVNGKPERKVHWSKDPNHPKNIARNQAAAARAQKVVGNGDDDQDPSYPAPAHRHEQPTPPKATLTSRVHEFVRANGSQAIEVIANRLGLEPLQVKGVGYNNPLMFSVVDGKICLKGKK